MVVILSISFFFPYMMATTTGSMSEVTIVSSVRPKSAARRTTRNTTKKKEKQGSTLPSGESVSELSSDAAEHSSPGATAKPFGIQSGRGGARFVKHTCFQCKKKVWCSDFREGAAANLSSLSVCMFCQLAAADTKIRQRQVEEAAKLESTKQALFASMDGLRREFEAKMAALEARITALETQPAVQQDSASAPSVPSNPEPGRERFAGLDGSLQALGKRVASLEKARASPTVAAGASKTFAQVVASSKKKSSTPQSSSASLARPSGGPPPVVHQQKVAAAPVAQQGKKKKSRAKGGQEPTIAHDTLLIGDSLVGGQTATHFASKRRSNKVSYFPGARVQRLTREIAKLEVDRDSTLVISVGGNDLFMRDGRCGSSQKLLKDYTALLGAAKRITNRVVVVGLLPRCNTWRCNDAAAWRHFNEALRVNEGLSALCRTFSLRFLNPWGAFYGRDAFFLRDGIHFSGRGSRKFADLVDSKLFRPIVTKPNVTQPIKTKPLPTKTTQSVETPTPRPRSSLLAKRGPNPGAGPRVNEVIEVDVEVRGVDQGEGTSSQDPSPPQLGKRRVRLRAKRVLSPSADGEGDPSGEPKRTRRGSRDSESNDGPPTTQGNGPPAEVTMSP